MVLGTKVIVSAKNVLTDIYGYKKIGQKAGQDVYKRVSTDLPGFRCSTVFPTSFQRTEFAFVEDGKVVNTAIRRTGTSGKATSADRTNLTEYEKLDSTGKLITHYQKTETRPNAGRINIFDEFNSKDGEETLINKVCCDFNTYDGTINSAFVQYDKPNKINSLYPTRNMSSYDIASGKPIITVRETEAVEGIDWGTFSRIGEPFKTVSRLNTGKIDDTLLTYSSLEQLRNPEFYKAYIGIARG